MRTSDAVALIESAVRGAGPIWADLGAGQGTFTRALAELLGRNATIYAVDRDDDAIASLERWAARASPQVVPIVADFSDPHEIRGLAKSSLDGILLANALHFVPDAETVLARVVRLVRPAGRVVLVEYDRRAGSQWVPYPIPSTRLPALAAAVGLSTPVVTATRPSEYSGLLYTAVAERVDAR